MPDIKPFVEDIEQVDESFRDAYVENDDGGYRLKALEGFVPEDKVTEHESVLNLKKTMQKERERANELEKQIKGLEGATVTDEEKEELKQLREARQKAEEDRKRREGEFDKWREEISGKHKKEIQDIVAERDQLRSAICNDSVKSQIAEACNEFQGRAKILEPLIRQNIQTEFVDGRVEVTVVDSDGTKKLDDDGRPLSIRAFVEQMSADKEYADLFASQQRNGGGSSSDSGRDDSESGSGGEKPDTKGLKRSEMSKKDKVAFIREHGEDEYMKLPL